MINFFRKIRKKMADDNRPLKYFRYAIGEIVLVVIGILIALQINNWNEQRKSKELMLINIQSIKDDIKADKLLLNKIINSLNNQIESGNYILPIMESEEHLILDFSGKINTNLKELLLFLKLSNQHRKNGTSFVIIFEGVDIDKIPDEINVVPTFTEALDILEMDAIERDLGF